MGAYFLPLPTTLPGSLGLGAQLPVSENERNQSGALHKEPQGILFRGGPHGSWGLSLPLVVHCFSEACGESPALRGDWVCWPVKASWAGILPLPKAPK